MAQGDLDLVVLEPFADVVPGGHRLGTHQFLTDSGSAPSSNACCEALGGATLGKLGDGLAGALQVGITLGCCRRRRRSRSTCRGVDVLQAELRFELQFVVAASIRAEPIYEGSGSMSASAIASARQDCRRCQTRLRSHDTKPPQFILVRQHPYRRPKRLMSALQ